MAKGLHCKRGCLVDRRARFLWTLGWFALLPCMVPAQHTVERSEIRPLAVQSPVLAACHSVEGWLVAVGERGHVLESVDFGRTWQQKIAPTRATLTGVDSSPAGTLIAVGHQGTILRREAGDDRWQLVESELTEHDNLLNVHHVRDETWWLLGAYGLFLVSTDDGQSWEIQRVSEDDFHLHHVIPLEGDAYLMVGEAGLLLGSTDGGDSWETLDSPYEGSFFGGLLLPSGQVLVHGLRGHLFVGSPWDEVWTEVRTEVQTLLASSVLLGDGRVLIGGLGGNFLVGDPASGSFVSWNEEAMPLTAHLLALSDGAVLVCGGAGPQRLTVPSADVK